MTADINLIIQQLPQDIVQLLQNSKLPIGILYYIVKDIFNIVSKEYQIAVQEAKIKQALPQQEEDNKDQEE